MDLGLEGRVALVAGASRGIGRAVALTLAREGADVGLLARSAEGLAAVSEEVRALGRRAASLPADAMEPSSLEAAVDALASALGPPTILIHSIAAVYEPRKLQFTSAEETAGLLGADLHSAIVLCRRVLPHMVEARFGRIVGIGSVAARTGVSGGTLYSASKAALEGLVRGIAVDYSRRGVTANIASVAFAETERLRGRVADSEAARDRLVKATATRRIPTPEEVADVVAFLCSKRASAITGAVVDVTAGGHLNNLW